MEQKKIKLSGNVDDVSFIKIDNEDISDSTDKKEPQQKKKKSKGCFVAVWIGVIGLMILFGVALFYFNPSFSSGDAFAMGLKGYVESVEEESDCYMIEDDGSERLVAASGEEQGLFDGNMFLAAVLGNEHGARIPFNLLLPFSTNAIYHFNSVGNMTSIVSKSKNGDVIKFFYDEDNTLIRQEARNNLERESIREYCGNEMTIDGCQTYRKQESGYYKDGYYVDVEIYSGSTPFCAISLNEELKVSRMFFPDFWRDNHAEYLFYYDSEGWLSRTSCTGKKGRGEITTYFSYSDIDGSGNWRYREADGCWRVDDTEQHFRVKTRRYVSYRNVSLGERLDNLIGMIGGR